MGNLKPGVKYVYERVGGIVYAREFGLPTSERFEIGRTLDQQQLDREKEEQDLWRDILHVAKDNVTLQKALDKAVLIYKTVKDS